MIKMAGIILIALGVLALVYQEFNYKETKQVAQIGSLTIQDKETKTVPLPPSSEACLSPRRSALLLAPQSLIFHRYKKFSHPKGPYDKRQNHHHSRNTH